MMKVSTEDFIKPCGCRSAGECTHNSFAEFEALDALVDQFAAAMKKKLRQAAVTNGKCGWDDVDWLHSDIRLAAYDHIAKGDPVDVANFAAFWWNRT